MADEEKGYEVVDKRKVKLNENGEAETTSEAETPPADGETPSEPQSEHEEVHEHEHQHEEEEFNLPPVDVYSLIRSFIGILGAQVWQWLGLIKNPSTGQIEKDLVQAKVAIDTIACLVSQIEPKCTPEEQREVQAMLSDLRMNFVRQSSLGQ